MSALPYMPLYVADYLADTAHLTALENGAYLMLIMNYWQRGNALPAKPEQLARIARVSLDEWNDMADSLAPFFDEVDGKWVHSRVEAELAKVREKSAKASNAGRASAQRTSNERSTDVEQTFNHTDTDTDTEVEEQKDAREARVSRGTRLPADFVPLPSIIELGRNRGLTEFEITDQLERFRDWANAATGQVGVKRDWQGTYRNWIKRVADDKLKSQQRRNGGKSSPGEQFRAAFSDLREHIETRDSPGHVDGNRADEGRDLFRGPGGSRRPGEP